MLARTLYSLLFALLLPAIVLRLLWRSVRAPGYRQRMKERFACFPAPEWSQRPIWLHCVSVGETLAAVPLIRALQGSYPNRPLVITTTTPTGSAQVQKIFADEISRQQLLHLYSPYDLACLVRRFLKQLQPSLLVLMETEIWPNTLHSCTQQGIPVVLANARLSQKSFKGYQRIRALVRPALQQIRAVAAQFDEDGQRFIRLGLPADRLHITGSIKFDLNLTSLQRQEASDLRTKWHGPSQRLICLAASTHSGEDEIILNSFQAIKKNCPDLLLVIVPRHPERFDEVYRLCVKQAFNTVRLNQNPVVNDAADIILGDVMGRLLILYGICDIAFVGGSLVPVGGHNLIEPAAWGKPILTGPYLHNFHNISRLLLENDGLFICQQEQQLTDQLKKLIDDKTLRIQTGERALQVALHNQGALEKLLNLIEQTLGP